MPAREDGTALGAVCKGDVGRTGAVVTRVDNAVLSTRLKGGQRIADDDLFVPESAEVTCGRTAT
ncbi:hypothetical protein N7925_26540 [Streptomyces sp. CA-278952]|uniref:hypothetical protein n=1 Tax=unclassified Streptomyces TaxID=2593676 RepID=UPI00224270CE|nr:MULTISPECIES: hypothetical protein [unclassified Streptomyces]UZI31574.1 hypothetical protein OH133_27735 [Streptomyces sp. VB1]WDG31622.1 hypothetical protein N7925_26540 [Streptomyces sp. CA-278952]